MSQTVDLLEQLQQQFATDRDALTLGLDRLRGEEKRLEEQMTLLSETLRKVTHGAHLHAVEMREKATAASSWITLSAVTLVSCCI